MRVVSGIQPSGRLHLGNYFGAVAQFLRFQAEADEALYFVADLHALTTVHDGRLLARQTRDIAADLLSLGLDPERSGLFVQSAIAEVTKLAWLLATITPVGLLRRGHSYKDKVEQGLPASVGLFTYPVLMAADILLYGADAVPVGQDQAQHLEFARDIATKFNATFVPGFDPILKPPRPIVLEASAVVPGVDGRKMSKSYGNTIDLFVDEATVRRQVMAIKTDSTPVDAPKPEPAPLLSLLTLLCGEDEGREHQRSWRAGGVGYASYKRRLLERYHELFGGARQRRRELGGDEVERALALGRERARACAAPLWREVVRAAGIEA
jgi:tryptophanyl-tRNA synthetase